MVSAFAPTRHLLGFEPKGLPVSPTPSTPFAHALRAAQACQLLTRLAISPSASPSFVPRLARCSSPDPPSPPFALPPRSSLRVRSRSAPCSPPLLFFGHKPSPTLLTRPSTRNNQPAQLRFEVKPLSGADSPALPDLEASFFWIQTNRGNSTPNFGRWILVGMEAGEEGLAGVGELVRQIIACVTENTYASILCLLLHIVIIEI